MFELRTALSYIVPKKGQLTVSVVGVLAIFVLQAITWLVLVFFSTTESFETRWTQKIVSILGPLRIVPTHFYYNSPFHLIDTYSTSSSFMPRRLSQKVEDPYLLYNSTEDPPLPRDLQEWFTTHAKDPLPTRILIDRLNKEKMRWRFFESSVAHMLFPSLADSPQKSVSQYSYVLGFESLQTDLLFSSTEFTNEEFVSLLTKLHDHPPELTPLLQAFVQALGKFEVIATKEIEASSSQINISPCTVLKASFSYADEPCLLVELPSNKRVSLSLAKTPPPVKLYKSILTKSLFLLRSPGVKEAYLPLSFVQSLGYPILLPKSARQQNIHFFDTGFFQIPGLDSKSGSCVPFYVAGFFDPGVLPTGGKIAITALPAVVAIHPELSRETPFASSGIVLDAGLDNLAKTGKSLKKVLGRTLSPYFTIQRYDQGELTSELYQQLSSEKLLFRLLSFIIIAVACSNIFSMLFVLAHDRRKEIAVMRALGASKMSITAIFLFTGLGIGLVGSLFGAALAGLTLHYLPEVLSLIGKIQGHEVLSSLIYGEITAQKVNTPTLLFTLISVSFASALAGSLAALRACRIDVSESLKGGG